MDTEPISPPSKTPEEIAPINLKIDSYKKDIMEMNLAKQSIKIPQRSLIYQFKNLRYGNRNIENVNRLKKMRRRKLSGNIFRTQRKINILQSSI